MSMQQHTVEALFGAALDLPTEQRCTFLDRACHGNPGLRRVVQEMLEEDERAGSFLATPAFEGAAASLPGSSGNARLSPAALSPPASRFAPLQRLADRFVVVRFIARGGMGEVYEVEDELLQGARVALKIIRPEIAADVGSSHRFEQEVILARKVNHPNLCPIYEIFRCEQPAPAFLFLTMKLLHGETLNALLDRSQRLSRADALALCSQIISGVKAIHAAGIIHRDLKPTNIMLEQTNGTICCSIMDFGLARLHASESLIQTQTTLAGTPGYLAPELLHGQRPSQATDLFALGVVLHQVLTGERPSSAPNGIFVSASPALAAADAPAALLHAVREFLSVDPDRRCRAFAHLHASSQVDNVDALSTFTATHRQLSRRSFVLAGGASACVLGGLLWKKHNGIYDLLHPLPQKRFVALLDWPPPSDPHVRPMIMGLIDAMANELARVEAFDHNFFITSQKDTSDLTTPKQLNEARESLGANLVLATSAVSDRKDLRVLLQVLDTSSGRTLRSRELSVPADQTLSLPQQAVRLAADLLGVTRYEPSDKRSHVGTDNAEALALFQAAEALFKQPNNAGLDQAIENYQAAIEADRHFTVAHAHLAIAYLRQYFARGDSSFMTLARGNAETAVSLDSNSVEAHVALGCVHQDRGALKDALREMEIALSLDPSDTRTMTYQAQIYADMDRWPEAEAAYKRVLRLRPNYWLAYEELGNTYSFQGNFVDALAAYRASAAAAPGRSVTFNNIAAIYFQLGSFPEALTAADRSIALAPVDVAYRTRSDILRAQGKYAEALKSALEGARLNPADGANWLEVGDAYTLLSHRAREAAEAYRRASDAQTHTLQVNPNDGPATMLLALYRIKSGDPSTSLALLRKAEIIGAADSDSQLYKVRVLELLGRRDEAVTTLAACMRKGVTVYQVRAVHDLDALRLDPRFPGPLHPSVTLPT